MTTLTSFEIRLNLIDAVAEFLKDEYADISLDEGQDKVLDLLRVYRNDTLRLMQGKSGDLRYLFDELKYGVRLAGALMDEILENESQSLIGWYHGKAPSNMVQFFYNMLSATVLELSKSILKIEEQHHALASFFRSERAQYASSLN